MTVSFQAIEIQLQGPVPDDLYHRYVEFKPFVAGMFTSHSLRGRILNHALHHQHARIYNYDRSTLHGNFKGPCPEFTELFLNFVDHGQRGRIFTYVLTLDGQFRFTETGKEFGIDLLSKHTMHSDVSTYIAFSGEFFVRRRKRRRRFRESISSTSSYQPKASAGETEQRSTAADDVTDDAAIGSQIEDNCFIYELIIDNDSGTYRPNAEKLSLLREFMSKNFPGLYVTTLDCQKDEERMNRLKESRRAEKQRSQGNVVYMQQKNDSSSSLSSSDEEELLERADIHDGARHVHAHPKQKMKDVKGRLRTWIEATDEAAESPKSTSSQGSSSALESPKRKVPNEARASARTVSA